jgi:pilus assembly protein CpaB
MTRPQAVTIVTIVALAFAGLASWGVYSYLQKETSKAKSSETQTVVVAAGEIPIGTKLDPTQMRTASIPRNSMQPGSVTDPKTLVGRVVIRQLSVGDAITEQKMMPREGTPMAGVMTYIVPQGHRAITVAVNEVAGVAGFVAPNNRVDIVLTTPIPNNPKNENISKIVLQNVTVLATGQITEQKEGKPAVVPTVTLDLLPEDSEKLILAASKGSLQLLLRNIVDTAPVEAKGATISKVLGGVETPVVKTVRPTAVRKTRPVAKATVAKTAATAEIKPAAPVAAAPLPPKKHYLEIIKGKDKSVKEFTE